MSSLPPRQVSLMGYRFNHPSLEYALVNTGLYGTSSTFQINWLIIIVGRVFDNGTGDRGSIPGRVIPKTLKMTFHAL